MENLRNKEIKQEIIEKVNSKGYQPMTLEEFYEIYKDDIAFDDLSLILNELVNEFEIFVSKKKNKYISRTDANCYKGKIVIRNPNYGFIISNDFEYDFYVSKYDFLGAMDKDEVLFSPIRSIRTDNNDEAKVIKILKRSVKFVVGEMKLVKDIYYLDEQLTNSIKVKIVDKGKAKTGNIVRTEITKYGTDYLEAKVIEVIGDRNDIGIDISQIAISYGFSQKFDDDVLYSSKQLEDGYLKEKDKRRDLTNEIIFTIDGDDALDLDDAVGITKLNNGNYKLGVYIADVSYYVTEDSIIDKEAYNRGTSVYLANRVIPMLPEVLSNDLCSLNSKQPKLVIGCEMEIDDSGMVITSDIFEGIINTVKKCTYSKCNLVLNEGIISAKNIEYDKVYDSLLLMRELASILSNKRHKQGSLDFDIPEGKVVVDEMGEAVDIVIRDRGESEKIIEEFMILANETIASTIEHLDLPFIYRVHDKPSLTKLQDLRTTAGYLGYSIRGKYVNEFQKFLEEVEEKDAFLKTMVLRMMAKAVYSEENIGHFGLASDSYTHFTSPIRRYPDLIVHRLIRKYIFKNDIDSNEFSSLTSKIHEIANHSSAQEQQAADCEFTVLDMKKAEYMANFINEEFVGTISSITDFGMFITLPNTVEGLVRYRDMSDDFYRYKPIQHIALGERTNRKYRIGDSVKVKVIKSDKKTRVIDFKIVYNNNIGKKYGQTKPKQKNNRKKQKSWS